MTQLTTFSFANVSVLIDGSPVTGFWEGDDAIVVERNAPDGNAVVGVDGDAVVSRPVNNSVTIKLKVSPTSAAHQLLTQKKRNIDNNLISDFAVSITDTGNGEGGAATQATILQAPNSQFGENASEREWTLFANDWVENAVAYTL